MDVARLLPLLRGQTHQVFSTTLWENRAKPLRIGFLPFDTPSIAFTSPVEVNALGLQER